jgi:hypothetical protein
VANAIVTCELCSREVIGGTRLCGACGEMVQRISDATKAVTGQNDVSEDQGELLKKKSERAKAKAESLTPIILG